MPTYEYQCANGHTFDLFQRISDRPKGKCPECGAKATRLISGGAGLIFKGSGFYITDYGKDGKGPRKEGAGAAESTPAKSDGADGASKTDATPQADAPAKAEKSESAAPKKPAKKTGKSAE